MHLANYCPISKEGGSVKVSNLPWACGFCTQILFLLFAGLDMVVALGFYVNI